ncbi:MAG: DUF362 domain-containing protein [Deltaproteobacteria bacterium]|jgi:hypothetical protein|nr:DUF362 domain-containing protein [Deltaproteobacteria bacterium]MBT4269368.1 DUF362 domain-containing protein [Deltaproteobacteria bacterium]MBT4638695.1 DUF362 domain-containing protein [Deltaproteobacteria bacterium]MBT6498979.1 DUF362 domain-containing protein [Deltaproteobacteria bacterium]MBT7156153.1 DUF362 domain-containing protein [Deltaproteobacteria bacterium]
MEKVKPQVLDSPIGKQEVDSSGSVVGVVRMDVDQSYAGTGDLLQNVINNADQDSWDKIIAKIDYTYQNLNFALSPLEEQAGLSDQIKKRVKKGQKLLFKPNLVNPQNIDPQTHGPDAGNTACTEWPFIAALMRWFHDKIGVSYYQMAIGEAATTMTATAGGYSHTNPGTNPITTEAVIEGRSGDFYGGWGFYFVRKYLAESLENSTAEDPLSGFQESMSGTYIPPGYATDKLMVYDLNRIYDDTTKGRECEIPDGVNYQSIVLHKVIVGGNPDDPEDLKAYPGCILVNVPKFKVHSITLFTNVIKNLGIGLYPMQFSSKGGQKWDYSIPLDTDVVGIKGGIPHQVWVPQMDHQSCLPKRDEKGCVIVDKTGGITATMIDIIKAVCNQDIFMIHVVDGIEAINIDHQGINIGEKTPEGLVFAGLDAVATDNLCARYMFKNISLEESIKVRLDNGSATGFPQKVPIPEYDGANIISKAGHDCPLARDVCFERAEERGIGNMKYFAQGHDTLSDAPIVSVNGHLGTDNAGKFSDLITKTLFYDTFSVPWDLQKTTFSYLSITDKLEGASRMQEFLQGFDENLNGTVSYEEFGKKGIWSVMLHTAGEYISLSGREKLGYLKGRFKTFSIMCKNSDRKYNVDGHDTMKEFFLSLTCSVALRISRMDMEFPDPFIAGLTCGKGKWPSFQLAEYFQTGMLLYGSGFPFSIQHPCLYSSALFYADLTQNGGQYAGQQRNHSDPEAIARYLADVNSNNTNPLNFTFYVPAGFNDLSGTIIPNVAVTDDADKVLTAQFENGKEFWP